MVNVEVKEAAEERGMGRAKVEAKDTNIKDAVTEEVIVVLCCVVSEAGPAEV